jgi:hypothetical protein
MRRLLLVLVAGLCIESVSMAHAQTAWILRDEDNPDLPGRRVEILHDNQPVARFIYGEGQMKPFLHVFGAEGELLTNGGLNEDGRTTGAFPHHRGIFIGWRVRSELGNYDLWHMNNGGRMEVLDIESLEPQADSARLTARIAWRAGSKDESGSDLLLTETRRLTFRRTSSGATRVDARFTLAAARELRLAGDLQHAGVHFRAANEVHDRRRETAYLTAPASSTEGDDLQWCRLLFPIGDRWYSCQQMNAPSNPVEELSTRNYGRFGYFFRRALELGEPLHLDYRFLIEPASPPDSASEAADRAYCDQRYQEFVRSLR